MQEDTTEQLAGRFSVTIPALIVFSLTLLSALRVAETIVSQPTLEKYGAPTGYMAASGAFWTVMGLATLYAFWKQKRLIARATSAVSVLYFAWYWVDRLFIQPTPAVNTTFSAIFSVILLTIVLYLLNFRQIRSVFSKETG
jgi:hypothetical protein